MKDIMKRNNEKDLMAYSFTDEEKQLIKDTIAPGQELTDAEFLLFAYVCKKRGLDPFLKQVIPVKFSERETGKKTLTFITTVDALRAIAQRTGQYGGCSDYYYDSGLTMYEYLEKKRKYYQEIKGESKNIDQIIVHPHTASCTVYKVVNGIKIETTATARWIEYYPSNPKRAFHWKKMPFMMLGKVAEALALRKAFPFDLSGLYTEEEMANAETPIRSFEDNEDLIDQIEEKFTLMGLNEAERVKIVVEMCGTGDLHMASRPALEGLLEILDKEDRE